MRIIVLLLGVTLISPLVPCARAQQKTAVPALARRERALRDAQRFGRLWLSRRQRKIAPELIKMLAAERTAGMREALVAALGRLEDPQALKPLASVLAQVRAHTDIAPGIALERHGSNQLPLFRVQLAIARIKFRSLNGRPKLDALARSIGTTWPQLQAQGRRLHNQAREREGSYLVQDDPQLPVLQEFGDVLYRMGKHGENIRNLGAFDLMVWSNDPTNIAAGLRSQEQAKLLAANLSDEAELKFWLQRSLPPSALTFSPGHVLDLGPKVRSELLRYSKIYLNRAKSQPQSFEQTSSAENLFLAIGGLGDKQFLPVLREFQRTRDSWTRNYATGAIRAIERGDGLSYIRFP